MAVKLLFLVLLCALIFTSSNSMRPGMEKRSSPLMEKRFWQHFPYFGGGLGGKGVRLGHGPSGAGFGRFSGGNADGTVFGNPRRFSSGSVGRNGNSKEFSGGDSSNNKGEIVGHGGQEGSDNSFGGGNGGMP